MKTISITLLLILASFCPQAPAQAGPESAAGHAEFKTCRARWTETELILGNSHFERVWRIKDGLLTAVSFRDLDAKIEWLAGPAKLPAPLPEGSMFSGKRALAVTTRSGRLSPVEEESLAVEMKTDGVPALSYRFQIFPAAHGVQIQFKSDAPSAAAKLAGASAKPEASTGVETNPVNPDGKATGDSLEDLMLAPQHLRFTQVTLRDQTDDHNELVFENEWLLSPNERLLRLPGNIFFVEDTLTGSGLLFLKQAPLPHARPVKSDWDADMSGSTRRLRFAGQGYPFVLLAYSGGRSGRIEVLQTYQRQLRQYDPQRDAMFLSNTWGDRSRDARINEAFILKEIAAGARLGVDVVQIDDGWQKGRTANSAFGQGVWNGYWASDPEFWKPHPQRFPNGLAPIVAAAREQHMKFGLWFAPDSSLEAANWNRDAGLILDLHKNGGIDYIKIDSVKSVSPGTEANLRKFYDRVLQESAGKVVFDIDATAEIRPTYFGIPDVGPIFVENRYTDWHRYWPHLTLRNLWKLSQYVDPLRMRMEFLNHTRSTNQYSKDPLAPAQYSPDALFATVMFANPLGWFEVSNLPEDYIQSVSKLVAVWKRERSQLFSGHILPIGSAPDGVSWTGFASLSENHRSGYLLLFRELNEQAAWTLDLSCFGQGSHKVKVLAGHGSAKLTGQKLTATIPQTLQYLWLKID